MREVGTLFYKDLYDIKAIDRSIWNDIFSDRLLLNVVVTIVWYYLFPLIEEYYIDMIEIAKVIGHFHDGFLNILLVLLKKEGL